MAVKRRRSIFALLLAVVSGWLAKQVFVPDQSGVLFRCTRRASQSSHVAQCAAGKEAQLHRSALQGAAPRICLGSAVMVSLMTVAKSLDARLLATTLGCLVLPLAVAGAMLSVATDLPEYSKPNVRRPWSDVALSRSDSDI
mmetsp:Transcript_12691/g.24873  ORF Transcript_12691/g.24873 Transcript_12691/m.24873 type:complete len:141 (+) Transcript_12691:66-488(+)